MFFPIERAYIIFGILRFLGHLTKIYESAAKDSTTPIKIKPLLLKVINNRKPSIVDIYEIKR
ncbi:hypothetical protein GCM10011412_32090 [Maribacter cobaltidurans]|nr:hypothetical protein GCM10011412_32090 [Maribacter cobaltidurans]